jgi:hypothetical protein
MLLQKEHQKGIWSHSELTDLYDVFEPTYLKATLEKFPHLGHMVFGKSEWPELGMMWQARVPAVLAALHNFIQDHNLLDIEADDGPVDLNPGACTGELADRLPRTAEKEHANSRRDDIMQQMWAQYQAY